MLRRQVNLDLKSQAFSSAGSTILEARRLLNRPLTIADVYEFFKKPVSSRKIVQIDVVAKYLCDIPYFNQLRTDHNFLAVKECATYMQYEYSPPGRVSAMQYLFRQGEEADRFYVILEGQVGVQIKKVDPDNPQATPIQVEVAEIGKGKAFGDYALQQNDRRGASIFVKQNSHFLVLYKGEYLQILGKVEAYKLKDKVEFLQSLLLFQRWSVRKLSKLSYAFEVKRINRGQVLFKEGSAKESVYLVKEGEFQLLKKHREPILLKIKLKRFALIKNKVAEEQVAILAKGELLGEDSGETHTCTCMCVSTTGVLLEISAKTFAKRIVNRETMVILKESTKVRELEREKRKQDFLSYGTSLSDSPVPSSAKSTTASLLYRAKVFSSIGRNSSQKNLENLDKTLEQSPLRSSKSVSSLRQRNSSLLGTERKDDNSRDRSPTVLTKLERRFEQRHSSLSMKQSESFKAFHKLFPLLRKEFTQMLGGVKLHSVSAGMVIRSQSPITS